MTIHRDAAYVKNPYFCPFCKSDIIVASKLESFENVVYQWVRCGTCETEWHDIFELVGYEEVVAGLNPDVQRRHLSAGKDPHA